MIEYRCDIAKALATRRRDKRLTNDNKICFDRKEAYEIGVICWIVFFSFILGWITALKRIKV